MSIKQILSESFSVLKDEREINLFLNEVITFLHDINLQYSSFLEEMSVFSRDRLSSRSSGVDRDLKQAIETIKENIKVVKLVKKVEEVSKVITERDNLRATINRAQSLIDEAKSDSSKAKRIAITETKNKLQITRDRLVSTAATSNSLGEQLNLNGNRQAMEDTINNILMSIGVITDELISLGLWNVDEEKPNVVPIKLISNVKTPKKSSLPKERTVKNSSDDRNGENL